MAEGGKMEEPSYPDHAGIEEIREASLSEEHR